MPHVLVMTINEEEIEWDLPRSRFEVAYTEIPQCSHRFYAKRSPHGSTSSTNVEYRCILDKAALTPDHALATDGAMFIPYGEDKRGREEWYSITRI